MSRRIGLAVVILFSFFAANRLSADAYSWTGNAGGLYDWSVANNWFNNTTGTVNGFPSLSTDSVTITGGTGNPRLDANQNIGSLTITGKSLNSAGALRLNVYGDATITGAGTFASNIILVMWAASTLNATRTLGSLEVNATGLTVLLGNNLTLAGYSNIVAGVTFILFFEDILVGLRKGAVIHLLGIIDL